MRTIEWYSRVAEEYRALGDSAARPESKDVYYRLADDYDRLVRQMKNVAPAERRPAASPNGGSRPDGAAFAREPSGAAEKTGADKKAAT